LVVKENNSYFILTVFVKYTTQIIITRWGVSRRGMGYSV